MAMQVNIPKLGISMTEGIVAEWLVEDSSTVTEGAPILRLETDKVETEIEAPAGGVIRILVEASEDSLPVGTVVAEIH